ncbi:MAG: methionine adenosyltransferase, partial [Flavobacteriaceae bacterium]|nr:methionine adenosyltransferase [Flavobacteriaceae bacterium]
KMCDQISDAVLDALFAQDPMSRVACETAVKTGFVLLLGEVTTKATVNFDELVRKVVNEIGFDHSDKGFDGNTCGVQVAIAAQSPDIAQGVDAALEVRGSDAEDIDKVGAGDQGMMFGFACDETPELMPMPISLAHQLTKELARQRHAGEVNFLRPDAKSQVTVRYQNGKPSEIDTIVISTQHSEDVSLGDLKEYVIEKVIRPTLPSHLLNARTRFFI